MDESVVRAVSLSGLFGMTHTHPSENFEIRQETDLRKPTLEILENLPPDAIFFCNFDFNTPLEMLVFSVKTVNEGCEM